MKLLNWTSGIDVYKCLERVKLPILMRAQINPLPFNHVIKQPCVDGGNFLRGFKKMRWEGPDKIGGGEGGDGGRVGNFGHFLCRIFW